MKTETLFERPRLAGTGDALKQTMKNFGARARDSGLASLGFKKARGRLSIRIITNKLVNDFMVYVGAQDIHPVTDKTVRDYIQWRFGDQLAAVEPTIQQIAGAPPGTQPPEDEFDQHTIGTGASDRRQGDRRQQPPPPPAPEPAEDAFDQYTQGTGEKPPPPEPAEDAYDQYTQGTGEKPPAEDAYDQYTQGTGEKPPADDEFDQYTQGINQPTPPPPVPPNNVANVASTRQSTPDEMKRYQALLSKVNQAANNPTPDPQFMNKITAFLRSASGSTNLRHFATLKINELKGRPDVTDRYPEITNIGDDPFANLPRKTPRTAPPEQPAPEPAASTEPAAATGQWRPVRPGEVFQPGQQFRMNQTTGVSDVYEPAAPSPQPAQQNNGLLNVPQSLAQIGPIVQKPNPTQQEIWWVMAALKNALSTTQRGSPQRQEAIATLRALQNNPQVVEKIPQLKQIPMENHRRVFDLAVFLVENRITNKADLLKACQRIFEDVTLNRSQIDQIFKVLARNLSTSGLADTEHRFGKKKQTGLDQGNSGHSRKPLSATTIITPANLQRAEKYKLINPNDFEKLRQAVGKNGASLRDITNAVHGKFTDEMTRVLDRAGRDSF